MKTKTAKPKTVKEESSTADDIISVLLDIEFSQKELESISDALRVAYRRDRQHRLESAQSNLKGGDLVRIDNIRPKNLCGSFGKVSKFNHSWTRADVTLTETRSVMRRAGDVIRGVPLVCLTKV